jgi:hypothetical protein
MRILVNAVILFYLIMVAGYLITLIIDCIYRIFMNEKRQKESK